MMVFDRLKTLAALLLVLFVFTGCNKDDSKSGCLDPLAENFDPEATTPDNTTCTYHAIGVFFYDEQGSQQLIAEGATELRYHIDDRLVATRTTSDFWPSEPDCLNETNISFIEDLGTTKSKTVQVRIEDQNGNVKFDFEWILEPSNCNFARLSN